MRHQWSQLDSLSHYYTWKCFIPTRFVCPFFKLELPNSNYIYLFIDSCLAPIDNIH